jgi:dolichol-phosphate mannosyltransferase
MRHPQNPDPQTDHFKRRLNSPHWASTELAPELSPELSLVVPIHNEQQNLEPLVERICEVLDGLFRWELLLVDDGSTDGSASCIKRLALPHANVRGIYFPSNCGQTAAIAAGIGEARGELLATLDGDLQNDPGDLLPMIEILRGSQGAIDAVVGWRIQRNDNLVRRISSRVANALRNAISGDDIRDTGCSLKVFRTAAISSLQLFEGMHRFLPTLLRYHGYRVAEHPVSHFPRRAGVSKYGIRNRVLRAFLDLLVVRWMRSRLITTPIQTAALPQRTIEPTPRPGARASSELLEPQSRG